MSLRSQSDPYIIGVIDRLQRAGYETYLVGGAVRDILLNRKPKDYDISTSATPEEVRRVFRDRRTMIIGRRFRLVHLYKGRDITEISTFRKQPQREDQTECPKHFDQAPENMIFRDNEFGSALDDAFRRDFTVNAIFYDPVHDIVVDHTGLGLKDLENGIVRTIGNPELRFEEDPVRILRAIKLAGQYGFHMEPATEAAVRKKMELIHLASPSRLTLELEKILKSPYTSQLLRAFHEYGFLAHYLPNLDEVFDTPQVQYSLALLDMRCERICGGLFRTSLSSAIAMLTLPFVELHYGETHEPGGLWAYYPGIESDMKGLIRDIFHPMCLTHRTTADTVCNLMMQPKLHALKKFRDMVNRNGYSSARELAIIQNILIWNIADFEERCPVPERMSRPTIRRKRGRPHQRMSRKDEKDLMQEDELSATMDSGCEMSPNYEEGGDSTAEE